MHLRSPPALVQFALAYYQHCRHAYYPCGVGYALRDVPGLHARYLQVRHTTKAPPLLLLLPSELTITVRERTVWEDDIAAGTAGMAVRGDDIAVEDGTAAEDDIVAGTGEEVDIVADV